VERQKLVRQIRQLRSSLSTSTKVEREYEESLAKEHSLIDDLCYVLYYPKSMKYIALFPNDNGSKTESDKIQQLKLHARNQARLNRAKDLKEGNIDKVLNAISIELKEMSNKKNPNQPIKAHDHKMSIYSSESNSFPKSFSSTSSSKKRKLESETYYDTMGNDQHPKSWQHDGDTNADNDDGDDLQDSDDVSRNFIEPQRKLKQKTKNKDEPSNRIALQTNISNLQKEDPFFLEENQEQLTDTECQSLLKHIPQVKVAIGDLKNQFFQRKARPIVVENDGTMTKQELRLLNWQLKVRNRKKFS
jgi:hypothetical protein